MAKDLEELSRLTLSNTLKKDSKNAPHTTSLTGRDPLLLLYPDQSQSQNGAESRPQTPGAAGGSLYGSSQGDEDANRSALGLAAIAAAAPDGPVEFVMGAPPKSPGILSAALAISEKAMTERKKIGQGGEGFEDLDLDLV
ncbi:hypothetical protein N0V88_004768 [Collariella sp. IMI 366227]|nr:hypothetical protein N0V88_004768 [Collariella sp. IMI 366227]